MERLCNRLYKVFGGVTASILLLALLSSSAAADPAPNSLDRDQAFATVSGRLVNYWGIPFAEENLEIFNSSNEPYISVMTDHTGKFSIELKPGRYVMKRAISTHYNKSIDTQITHFIAINRQFEVNSTDPIDLGDVQSASLVPFNAKIAAGGNDVEFTESSLPYISFPEENSFVQIPSLDEDPEVVPHQYQLMITPGKYKFKFPQQPLFQSITAEVTVPKQGLTDYTVDLPPFANIYRGKITNSEGNAVSAKIEIMDEQNHVIVNAVYNNPTTGEFALGWYTNNNLSVRVIPDVLETSHGKIGFVPETRVIPTPAKIGNHRLGDISLQEGDIYEGYLIDEFGPASYSYYTINELSERSILLDWKADKHGYYQFALPKDSKKQWAMSFNHSNDSIQVPLSKENSHTSIVNIKSGQVLGGIMGHITLNSPDGDPLENVRITFFKLQSNGQVDLHDKPKQVYSDLHGAYLAALAPGDYKLLFEKDGFQKGLVDHVQVTDRIDALNLTLQIQSLPPSNVFGSIVDAQGKPVANAKVIFSTKDNDPKLRVDTRDDTRFETDTREDGSFDIQLPEKKFMLKGVVQSGVYDNGKSQVVKFYRIDMPVNPTESSKTMLGMIQTAPLAPLQGTISLNGTVFTPPSLFVGFADDRLYYHVDPTVSDGLSLQVTPGKYLIIINSTPQSESKTQEIVVPKNGLTSLQIPLSGMSYLVTGKIVNEDGEPVRAGIVALSDDGQWHTDMQVDNETGKFQMGSKVKSIQMHIIPDAMQLDSIETVVYAPVDLNVKITDGTTKDLGQIVVPLGQLYTGILTKNGKPLENRMYEVYNTVTKQVIVQHGADKSGKFDVIVPVHDLDRLILRVDGHTFKFPSAGFDFGKLDIGDGSK